MRPRGRKQSCATSIRIQCKKKLNAVLDRADPTLAGFLELCYMTGQRPANIRRRIGERVLPIEIAGKPQNFAGNDPNET